MGSGSGRGEGSGGSGGRGVVWAIIWLLVLIFIAFFVAGFCAGFYIFFLPFTACIKDLKPFTDLLLKCVQFPYTCADAMVNQKSFGEVF